VRKKLHKVHDAFVKNLLSHKETASEFIRNALPPDIYGQFDLNNITYLPDTYVTKGLNEYISDIVLKIPISGTLRNVSVSILIEHKSSVDHFSCVQLLNYIANGYDIQLKQKEKLSIIIPVIYYHGKGKWKYRPLHELFQEIPEGFERYIPFFSIELFQVQHLNITQIYSIAEAKLRAAIMVQKSLHDHLVAQKDFVNVINALEPTDAGNFLHSFFVYLSNFTTFNQHNILEITNQLTADMKTKSMTFIDQFRAEGRQEGRAEGRQEGSIEKAYEFARKLILRNMPIEEIYELTELSMDEVKRLEAELRS
jgi:predicted transposase/invertase (TIGR01784 family)